MTAAVVVDLGGTRLKAGRIVPSESVPTEVLTIDHGGDWRAALATVLERFEDATELAMCVPGLVEDGRVLTLPGKLAGLEGTDLAAALGLPVLLANDAVAYGIGEATCGAGRGHSRVVTVTLGTGVGVAVTEDGVPLGRGPLGAGLLGGQLPLPGPSGGPVDSSGRTGTFEARCQAASLLASVPVVADLPAAYDLLRSGDSAAAQGFADYRSWLIRGLSALALAHAPSVLIVGGGVAQPGLLDGVEEAVAAQLWGPQRVEVRLAALGDAAALAGLGVLSRTRVVA